MKQLILLSFFISLPTYSIELVLNGTVYQIDSYKIENNGGRIVIPQKIKPKKRRRPASRRISGFNSLLNDVSGHYQKLEKDLGVVRSKPYKQDFR